jgi:hypothetical protein
MKEKIDVQRDEVPRSLGLPKTSELPNSLPLDLLSDQTTSYQGFHPVVSLGSSHIWSVSQASGISKQNWGTSRGSRLEAA